MNIVALAIAVLTVCFGLFTVLGKETRLFYKIVVFSAGSYLLSVIYRVLYAALIPIPAFHAGYLTYAGTFLFLLCAFFAEPKRNFTGIKIRMKILALIPASVIVAWGIWNAANGHNILSQILLVPVAFTAYYAFLGLFQQSKEGEYAHSLRLYHLVLLLFCIMQPIVLVDLLTRQDSAISILLHSMLSAATVLFAYRGCKQWCI